MQMNKWVVPFELKELTDDGKFSGYAAVYGNVDNGNDIIVEGAFKEIRKTRKGGKVRVTAYHDLQRIIGLADVTSDSKGLLVEGVIFQDVSYAKDAHRLMKTGALDSMSVGFRTIESAWEERDGEDIRIIKAAELFEVAVVPFGMNPEADIIDVKSDIRLFETQLRERMGLSQKDAAAVASIYRTHRDGGEADTETVDLKGADEILTKFMEKIK